MPPARIDEWLDRGPKVPFYRHVRRHRGRGAPDLSATRATCDASWARSAGPIPDVEIRVVTDDGTPSRRRVRSASWWRAARTSPAATGTIPTRRAERFGPARLPHRRPRLRRRGRLPVPGRPPPRHDQGRRAPGRRQGNRGRAARASRGARGGGRAAPHDLLGEVPVAFVALKDTLADVSTALRAHRAAHLTGYKVPLRVVVRSELPKLPGSGKLDRTTLRALAAETPFESPSVSLHSRKHDHFRDVRLAPDSSPRFSPLRRCWRSSGRCATSGGWSRDWP